MLSRLGLNIGPEQGSSRCNGGFDVAFGKHSLRVPEAALSIAGVWLRMARGCKRRREVYFTVVMGSQEER